MKRKTNSFLPIIFLIPLTIGMMIGCKPKFDIPTPDNGSVDASRYVAIGSYITAGYTDGALYYEAQSVSFANLLAGQFKLIDGGDFNIPFVPQNSNGISVIAGNTISINAKSTLVNKTDCKGITALGPLKLNPTENYGFFSANIYNSSAPFNNLGIPNTKIFHVAFKGYGDVANNPSGNFNPFYQRIASNFATSSILSDAVNQNPTFFSLLIGSEDVMGFALSGGVSDTITPLSRFNNHVDTIINNLTKNGAKGVVGNIPDISSLPYFTTIPYNGLTIDQAQADQLNSLYTPLGINITFTVGSNPFVIIDTAANFFGFRQMSENEYILLNVPLDSVKCYSYGSLIPMPNKYVLTANEISLVQTAIANYNGKLSAAAQLKNLAFVDVNSFYKQIKTGMVYNGISLNAQFVKGGVFSLDGLQLNPVGQALLTNEFIKSINFMYGSTIPQVDVTKYKGISFP